VITTVIGNYPKIPDLPAPGKWRTGVERLQKGQIDEAQLQRIEDEVTIEAITEQIIAGVDVITDGQIRWEDAQTHFARRLSGFSINGLQRYFDTNIYFREPVAEHTVAWTGPITVPEFEFARAHSSKPVKAVVTGPFTLAKLSRNVHYRTLKDFTLALGRALNRELKALEGAGAQFIQVDEPAICQHKQEYAIFAEAQRALTDGVKAKKILCTYFGDISGLYPQILDLPFEAIGLDFVAGYRNWDAIAGAPFTRELQAGVLDARNTRVESVDELVSAVRRLTTFVSPGRLLLSPSAGLEFLPRSVARRKLAALVEGAKAAKEDLKGART
jgi:5-methyltetrahydropteroyltriglutamate--homocysteine methyltransferase